MVNALDNLAPAVDELENTAHWLNLMISELEEGLKDLELPSEDEEVLNTAIQELRAAYDDMQNASTDLKTAFAKLVDALIRNDDAGIEAAMGEVRSTLIKLGGAYREAGDAFGDISELLKTIQPDMAESTVPENAVTVSGNETEPMEPIQPDGEMTDELQNILYQMAEALEESGISWPGLTCGLGESTKCIV